MPKKAKKAGLSAKSRKKSPRKGDDFKTEITEAANKRSTEADTHGQIPKEQQVDALEESQNTLGKMARRLSITTAIPFLHSASGKFKVHANEEKEPELQRVNSTLAKLFRTSSNSNIKVDPVNSSDSNINEVSKLFRMGSSKARLNVDSDVSIPSPQRSRSFRRRRNSTSIFGSAQAQEKIMRRTRRSLDPEEGILQAILVMTRKLQKELLEAQNKKYEELFGVIDKDKGGTINVSTELGETLIRLGLGIDASVMRDAINSVCIKRGRKPDGWFDMNLSTPIYNEIDLEEFQEVMRFLSKDETNEFDRLIQARTVFERIDLDKDGCLSAEELWQICTETDTLFTVEDCRKVVKDVWGNKGMSFEQFLEYTGCKGTEHQLLAAEIEQIRKELEECLVTFQTFDLDGSGTIDISETAEVMRAMGQKVSQRELDEIFNLCDPCGTGEIDFESFCTNVLCFSDDKARRLVNAHLEKAIFIETLDSNNSAKRISIDTLFPTLFAKISKEGKSVIEQVNQKLSLPASEKVNEDQLYVWQDFGQYSRANLANEKINKSELSKVLSRPFTIMMHRSHVDIFAAKMSPDGSIAALGCESGTLVLYDLTRPRPRELKRVSAHFHHTLCLDWSPDGNRLVTGGADGVVSMWDAVSLANITCHLLHSGYVRGIAWSPDGLLIASCGSDMAIILWTGENLRPTGTVLNGHTSWIRWCKFTEDSKRLISGGDDHTVIVWEVAEGIASQTLRGHSHVVSCGSFVPGSDKLFTAGFDGEVLVWTKDTGLLGYLKVFVVEAYNLKRGDTITGNMSNSRFVTVELGKGQKERTALKKGSSPAWYEEFDFGIWDLEEQVFIQVFDWDKDEAHRFLGSVKISLEELVYTEEGVTDKEFDLVDDEGEHGKASIALRFTYRAVASIGEVMVFVERARNLPRMDTFGLSDPFCMITLGKSEKQKTRVVKHNLNPEWNEEFVYNVEEGAREMKLVIYDWNLTQDYDFIGQLIIPVETLIATRFSESWYPLKAIDGSSAVKGEIKLKISFVSAQERMKKNIRFRRTPTTWPAYYRSDFNFYNPVGQVSFFGRVLLRGKCGFCGKHRNDHENDLRCDLGTGNYVHSIDLSFDGSLVAWGTGDGRIRLAMTNSAERLGCWTAHAGPVLGLSFSLWDMRLISWGADYRTLKSTELVRGAYVPKSARSERNQDNPQIVVETWYIASLLEDKEKWLKKKNQENSLNFEKDNPSANSGFAPPQLKRNSLVGDLYDSLSKAIDNDTAANEEHKKEEDEASEDENNDTKKQKRGKKKDGKDKEEPDQERIRKRLQKGARKLQGRVGYTPVYYDAPIKADGTLARSCLKGRSGKKPLRNGLIFNEEKPRPFNYPPEEPSSAEEDD